MSRLSGQLGKLDLQQSTHAFDESEYLGAVLVRLPSLSDLETFDTSALHTVSQRSSPPSPSLDGSDTSLDHGIQTPTLDLPPDPLDALDALEALALQPLCPSTPGDDLDPIEALLWSPASYDVHPFRERSQLYAVSEWREVPPPLPPKDTCDFASVQRRSLDRVKSAGVAATHRRAESAPTWQSTQKKGAWRMAQVKPAPGAGAAWGEGAPPDRGQVKHFHHHHYHHHHIHHHGRSS
jgi:hypothetical protein